VLQTEGWEDTTRHAYYTCVRWLCSEEGVVARRGAYARTRATNLQNKG